VILLLFVGIFLVNVAPAFTPPTWMVLSYVEVMYHPNHLLLVAAGTVAATAGRLVLARLSTLFLRNGVLAKRTVANVDVIREQLVRHRRITFNVFLFYAFGPLPSNQLFIAYGLTGLPLRSIALPFFLGRAASYSFWIVTASEISHRFAVESLQPRRFFGAYFVVVQVLSLLVVYAFTRIDWRRLIAERRLRWIR
jgi:hypothetical protein